MTKKNFVKGDFIFEDTVTGTFFGNGSNLEKIKDNITFNFTGFTTGVKQYVMTTYGFNILSWKLVARRTGSVDIDIWRRANVKPDDDTYSILGSEKIELNSEEINQENDLSNWTSTQINPSDVLAFEIKSISNVEQVALVLEIEK